ncbi:hypothetical protein GQX74_015325 [Glossina fuscipes]|nr:hypothetical protein GQX74_015325 [Glossina fuscipes]
MKNYSRLAFFLWATNIVDSASPNKNALNAPYDISNPTGYVERRETRPLTFCRLSKNNFLIIFAIARIVILDNVMVAVTMTVMMIVMKDITIKASSTANHFAARPIATSFAHRLTTTGIECTIILPGGHLSARLSSHLAASTASSKDPNMACAGPALRAGHLPSLELSQNLLTARLFYSIVL